MHVHCGKCTFLGWTQTSLLFTNRFQRWLATSLFGLEPLLSPALESIEADLEWLLLFDEMIIDSQDVNTVMPAILNCCYQFMHRLRS